MLHPNLVRTIDTASTFRDTAPKQDWEIADDRGKEAAGEAGKTAGHAHPSSPVEETWLLLEYCDQGSLIVCPLNWHRRTHRRKCLVSTLGSHALTLRAVKELLGMEHAGHSAAVAHVRMACWRGGLARVLMDHQIWLWCWLLLPRLPLA
jgi:hypothetical protein